jgi:cytochrome c oxidase cbb3-type subunit 4
MISGIITSLLLVLFVGAWVWAWSPKRKSEFDAAARLPLEESSEVSREDRR